MTVSPVLDTTVGIARHREVAPFVLVPPGGVLVDFDPQSRVVGDVDTAGSLDQFRAARKDIGDRFAVDPLVVS